MYPSIKQEELINKTIGCSRLVYNIMLSKKKDNSKLTSFDMIKEIPKLYNEYPFLKEVDSCSLRCVIFDLENGLNKYYKKQGGYPKYKKKGIKDSYRTNYIKNKYKNKIMKDIKIREYKCPKCGIEIERDINASINIMYEGIISYYKERYQN